MTIASMETPKLSGIVQIHETFIRDNQKISRKLESFLPKPNIGYPSYGYQPSLLGAKGPKFSTIITTI